MPPGILNSIKKYKNQLLIFVLAAFILDVLIWGQILRFTPTDDLKIYFLNVGQGDGALAVLPGGVKVLIDAGPANGRAVNELAKIMPFFDRYIDLVVLSHPQLDHFGGLIDVLKRYQIGAFLTSSMDSDAKAFTDLTNAIKDKNIRVVYLFQGDKVKHQSNYLKVLNPPFGVQVKDDNNYSLVLELFSQRAIALFTGDISAAIEKQLVNSGMLKEIQILKIPHHGSKFSSSAAFLNAVKPKISVIGVGKNSYGHPTKETIGRLNEVGAKIYRTDIYGTMKLVIKDGKIRIFKL